MSQFPPKTELSEAISKDLKQRGFCFVGPTIVYAFLCRLWAWSMTKRWIASGIVK
jgi:3-methyladenine DNA glycosylase Tag